MNIVSLILDIKINPISFRLSHLFFFFFKLCVLFLKGDGNTGIRFIVFCFITLHRYSIFLQIEGETLLLQWSGTNLTITQRNACH